MISVVSGCLGPLPPPPPLRVVVVCLRTARPSESREVQKMMGATLQPPPVLPSQRIVAVPEATVEPVVVGSAGSDAPVVPAALMR